MSRATLSCMDAGPSAQVTHALAQRTLISTTKSIGAAQLAEDALGVFVKLRLSRF